MSAPTCFDFLVIGAQKAGTSTLDRLLREHPGLQLPMGKEVPVLNEDGLTARRLERFFGAVYGAGDGRLVGKVSPQYLYSSAAAAQIAVRYPTCRLVVVLRDPLDRARSHFEMAVRRGIEHRSFAEAIDTQLAASGSSPGLGSPETECYLAWGRYGEWLSAYHHFAERGLLHVVRFDELLADSYQVLTRLAEYLGIAEWAMGTELPRSLPRGSDGRLAQVLRRARKLPGYDIAKKLVPTDYRHAAAFTIEERSVRPTVTDECAPLQLDFPTMSRVRDYFAADGVLLATLTGSTPSWLRTWNAS